MFSLVPSVAVMGQTVVLMATTTVVTYVVLERTGQLVTVLGQAVMVCLLVEKMVDVVKPRSLEDEVEAKVLELEVVDGEAKLVLEEPADEAAFWLEPADNETVVADAEPDGTLNEGMLADELLKATDDIVEEDDAEGVTVEVEEDETTEDELLAQDGADDVAEKEEDEDSVEGGAEELDEDASVLPDDTNEDVADADTEDEDDTADEENADDAEVVDDTDEVDTEADGAADTEEDTQAGFGGISSRVMRKAVQPSKISVPCRTRPVELSQM